MAVLYSLLLWGRGWLCFNLCFCGAEGGCPLVLAFVGQRVAVLYSLLLRGRGWLCFSLCF